MKKFRPVAVVTACAAVALACAPAPPGAADPPLVQTDAGPVRGADDGGTQRFTGIRFAAPPVGELRWSEPQPATPWTEPLDATGPGVMCPQDPQPAAPPISEDCLSVNVTVPPHEPGERLPVMLWWHGGGYYRDAGALYGARRLAEQGRVVVVTANYRLGVLGYFAAPGLPGSGTFGLADQIASLRWTERNAAAFGGDPDNITVFGQSAGATSTCAALTSPATEGLIDKAIMMSGACEMDWPQGGVFPGTPAQTPYAPIEQTEQLGGELAAGVGCAGRPDVVECLRALPPEAFAAFNMQYTNHLSYGTELLPEQPGDAVRAGRSHPVPVIVGSTRYEQRAQIGGAALVEPITAERLPALLQDSFGDRAGEVAARYPLADYPSAAAAWAVITTDRSFSCPTLRTAQDMARSAPVHAYEFADDNSPNVNGIEVPGLPQGAAHATDMPYLFSLGGAEIPLDPAQRRLSDQMIDYWTAFARSGDPNTPGAPEWAAFTDRGPTLSLAPDAVRPVDDLGADHHCDLWQTFG